MARERWIAAATSGVLGVVLAAWLWPLLAGETLFWGLPSLQFYPWRSLAFAQMRAGELPLWNPYNGGGVPLLANYQTAVFYPPNWLHLLLPDVAAMNSLAVGHVIWAGAGMWRFAGVLGLPHFGRAISVLAFALNGYVIGRLGSFPTVAAVAWMPWLFLAIHRLVQGRSARDVALLGLVSAMLLLAGHAQTAFYVLLAGGAYALWLAVRRPGSLRALGLAAGGVGLGAGLAAVQLLPTAELLGQSVRSSGLGYEWTTNFSYSLARALTLIAPNLYGTPADGSYLTEGAYFEDAAYPGLLAVIAAFLAGVLWLRQRRRGTLPGPVSTVPFWAGMGLLAFLIALGKNGFLFPLLYAYVPTFRSFQGPVRWLVLLVFALALLAGIGVSYAWGRGKWTIFWSRLALAGGIGLVIMTGMAAPRLLDVSAVVVQVMLRALLTTGLLVAACAGLTLLQPESRAGRQVMIWRAAVIVLLGADLFLAFRGLNPTVPGDFFATRESAAAPASGGWLYQPETVVESLVYEEYFIFNDYRVAVQRQAELRAALLPNMNIIDGVYLYNNFDPIDTQAHTEAVRTLESRLPAEPDGPMILAEGEALTLAPFGQAAVELGAGISALSGGAIAVLWWLGGRRRAIATATMPADLGG